MDTPLPELVGFIRLLEWSLNTWSTLPSDLSFCPCSLGSPSSPTSIGSKGGLVDTSTLTEGGGEGLDRVVVDEWVERATEKPGVESVSPDPSLWLWPTLSLSTLTWAYSSPPPTTTHPSGFSPCLSVPTLAAGVSSAPLVARWFRYFWEYDRSSCGGGGSSSSESRKEQSSVPLRPYDKYRVQKHPVNGRQSNKKTHLACFAMDDSHPLLVSIQPRPHLPHSQRKKR